MPIKKALIRKYIHAHWIKISRQSKHQNTEKIQQINKSPTIVSSYQLSATELFSCCRLQLECSAKQCCLSIIHRLIPAPTKNVTLPRQTVAEDICYLVSGTKYQCESPFNMRLRHPLTYMYLLHLLQ